MKAIKVWFDDEFIHVETHEHQLGKMPLKWFPSFENKTLEEKQEYELWDNGKWIHWEKIGEDLSVEGFFTFDKNKIISLQSR